MIFFNVDPVALKLATHNKIVFLVDMESCLLCPKCKRNALCTAVTDVFEISTHNECSMFTSPIHEGNVNLNKIHKYTYINEF